MAQGALVLQDTFRFGHGVRYGHAVVSTEDQQLSTAQVQIQEAVPPNHTPPGLAVVVHMSADVSQQDNRVPRWGTLQRPTRGLKESWVLRTVVPRISADDSHT